jgi:DNA repair exonuclease SbcCD ATPase subunit
LLVGDNGAGKSTIIQATPICLWGKPANDRKPMWTGPKPRVTITTYADDVYIRSPKGKPQLSWTGGAKYDRKGDAQDVVDQRFGTLAQWQRLNLLDGSAGGYISSAGPSDRRRILTSMAGLDGFDLAYKTASEKIKEIEARVAKGQGIIQIEKSKITMMDSLKPEEISSGDIEKAQDKYERAQEELAEQETDLAECSKRAKTQRDKTVALKARYLDEKAKQAKADSSGVCPTCGQSVALVEHHGHAVDLPAMLANLEAEIAKVKEEEGIVTDETALLATKRYNAMEAQIALNDTQARKQRYDQWKLQNSSLVQTREKVAELEAKLKSIQDELERAKDVAWLLSPNGPRGELLTKFCEVLSQQATALIQHGYGSEHWVRLEIGNRGVELTSSYGESPSRGQLRRFDIALALAGLQLAEAVANQHGSTLWIDEAFEVLDQSGVVGTALIIEKIARERCVVVVAHQAAEHLLACADAVYEVVNSTVTRVR